MTSDRHRLSAYFKQLQHISLSGNFYNQWITSCSIDLQGIWDSILSTSTFELEFDSQQLTIILSLIVSNWHLQLQGHDHDLSPAQLSYAPRMWGHGKVIPRCQIQSHTSTLPLHCINWNCSWSRHESIWIHKVAQYYLYFKVFNGGEVKD